MQLFCLNTSNTILLTQSANPNPYPSLNHTKWLIISKSLEASLYSFLCSLKDTHTGFSDISEAQIAPRSGPLGLFFPPSSSQKMHFPDIYIAPFFSFFLPGLCWAFHLQKQFSIPPHQQTHIYWLLSHFFALFFFRAFVTTLYKSVLIYIYLCCLSFPLSCMLHIKEGTLFPVVSIASKTVPIS